MAESRITQWLNRASPVAFSLYAIFAAFGTYLCAYFFRKTFTGTGFVDYRLWGMDYKTLLIITQTIGYGLAKFYGIKFIAEMTPEKRARTILLLIGSAEVFLFGFALTPFPYNWPFMFLNGMVLGMIWGLVFHYLEGRKNSDLLGAGLSVSFVVAGGLVKSMGKWLVEEAGIHEFWMPVIAGLFFVLPQLFFIWLLNQLPPPSPEDEALRTARRPMFGPQRRKFVAQFFFGLVVMVLMYMVLTALRGFRDDFANEIFREAGISDYTIFSKTEIPIAITVLVILGLTMYIRNNLRAFVVNHLIIFMGALVIVGGTLLFDAGTIDAVTWMILVGLGGYLGYIPFNCILFDRLIAAFKYVGTAGFVIYIADAFGYIADVSLKFFRSFGATDFTWTDFLRNISYGGGAAIAVLSLVSLFYFQQRARNKVSRD